MLALEYDRFGEFAGFRMADVSGQERRFHCPEKQLARVVDRAWADRITTTVLTRDKEIHVPVAIVLDHA